jgi:hypothetical protein
MVEVSGLVLGVPYNSNEIVTTTEILRGCPKHPPEGNPTPFCPVCGAPARKAYRDTPKEKLQSYLGRQVYNLAEEDVANFMDNLREPATAVGSMGIFQHKPLIFGILLGRSYKPSPLVDLNVHRPLADLAVYAQKAQTYADALGITWKDPALYVVVDL